MEIKDNKFTSNKTSTYLLPILKTYGLEFKKYYSLLFKLAIGIGDHVIPDVRSALFILIDTRKSPKGVEDFISWVREKEYYVMDYPFDDISGGYKHMIVVKIPESSYQAFIKSKYSEIYSQDQLKRMFSTNTKQFLIMTKDAKIKEEYVKSINEQFQVEFDHETWEHEIEFPIVDEEEMF